LVFSGSAQLLALLCLPSAVSAAELTQGSQFDFHFGMLSASFTGPSPQTTGSFSVTNTLGLAYESFSSAKSSYVFSSVLAYSLAKAQVDYMGVGFGRRFYLGSDGMAFEAVDKGVSIVSVPTWRYYAGFDGNVAMVDALDVTSSYIVEGAVFDLTGEFGIIYQLSRNVGLNFEVGLSYGFGFSSVALGEQSKRFLVGFTKFL
jgi:hypothetical protein